MAAGTSYKPTSGSRHNMFGSTIWISSRMGFTFESDWLSNYGKSIGVGKLGFVPWLSCLLVKAAERTCRMTAATPSGPRANLGRQRRRESLPRPWPEGRVWLDVVLCTWSPSVWEEDRKIGFLKLASTTKEFEATLDYMRPYSNTSTSLPNM